MSAKQFHYPYLLIDIYQIIRDYHYISGRLQQFFRHTCGYI